MGALLIGLCIALFALSNVLLAVEEKAKSATVEQRGKPELVDDKLKLALIVSKPSPMGDLLFASLVDMPEISMVDRDFLMEAASEKQLSVEQSVAVGRMANADALLFVEEEPEFLMVHLVETRQGVRLFEAAAPPTAASCETLADTIRQQLRRRAAMLTSTATTKRVYVAVESLVHKTPQVSQAPVLLYMDSLLSVALAELPAVFCVERKVVSDLEWEGAVAADAGSGLTAAHWLVRGSCEAGEKDESWIVVLNLRSLDGGTPMSRKFEMSRSDPLATVTQMKAWIASALQVSAEEAPPDRYEEARTQFVLGEAYAARGQRPHALRCLHIAHLLDPTNKEYIEALAKRLGESVNQRTSRLEKMAELVEAMDLIQFQLKQKVYFISERYDLATWPWSELPAFLSSLPSNLMESDRELIALFRRRFREYAEWLAGYHEGPVSQRHFAWLQQICPFFFDQPDVAMAYFRQLMPHELFQLNHLSHSNFLAVQYWDRKRARTLWRDLLDELTSSSREDVQFAALRALCVFHGAYENAHTASPRLSSSPSSEALDAIRRIFTWTTEKPGRQVYLMDYMMREVWQGFACMDMPFQQRYFESLMMPRALELGGNDGHLEVLTTFSRLHRAPGITPAEEKHLAGLLNQFLGTLCFHFQQESLEGIEKSYPDLMPLIALEHRTFAEQPVIHVSGVERVFDAATDMPEALRDNKVEDFRFGLLLEAPHLWLSWCSMSHARDSEDGKPGDKRWNIIVGCFDLNTRRWRFCGLPVNVAAGGFQLRRWGDNLCLADHYSVWALPFDPVSGELRAAQAVQLKGLPPLGTQAQSVTALIPGGSHLYVATTPGALFRWKPGMDAVQQLAGCDLLSPAGPLNDTKPYTVSGGHPGAAPGEMIFDLDASEGGPRKGQWRFKEKEAPAWEWIGPVSTSPPPVAPYWRNRMNGMHESHFEYVAKSRRVTEVASWKGILEAQVVECEAAAFWCVHDIVYKFEGHLKREVLQLFMLPSARWPEESGERRETLNK